MPGLSDDVSVSTSGGIETIASDSVGNKQYQRVKLIWGGDGVATEVAAVTPLPVTDAAVLALQPAIAFTTHRAVSAASDNLTLVAAGALKLYGGIVSSVNAAVRYLHLFDKATAPVLAADSSLLKATIAIPGLAAGTVTPFSIPGGLNFASGIAYAITTVAAGTTGNVSANEHIVNLWYK